MSSWDGQFCGSPHAQLILRYLHQLSQSIRDQPETSSNWYETEPALCYILPHLVLGIHNRYSQKLRFHIFLNWSFCSGLVPVVCLIFLNTKIYLAMKKLRCALDFNLDQFFSSSNCKFKSIPLLKKCANSPINSVSDWLKNIEKFFSPFLFQFDKSFIAVFVCIQNGQYYKRTCVMSYGMTQELDCEDMLSDCENIQ